MAATFHAADHPRGPDGRFRTVPSSRVSPGQQDRLRDAAAAMAGSSLQRLLEAASEAGLSEAEVADLAYEVKLDEADAINDAGVDAQVEYLGLNPASTAWRVSELERQVNEAKSLEAGELADSGPEAHVAYLAEALGDGGAEAELRSRGAAKRARVATSA